MIKKAILISLFSLLVTGVQAAGNLTARLDSVIADSMLDNARIGVSIFDISTDSIIYKVNSDKLFMPASNLKLFTSAAALELLGPSYRFETYFDMLGRFGSDSTLTGNLVITGGGDPLISGRFRDHMTEIFECWADSLRAKGINKISGDIIVNGSFFDPPELGPGWSWDDLSYWYACPVSALAFNDNCVDINFLPGKKIGRPAFIEIEPESDYISITNNTRTSKAGSEFSIDYYRSPGTNKVEFFGNMAIDDTNGRKDYVSVNNPGLYCAIIFKNVLSSRNIKVIGQVRDLPDYMKMPGYLKSEFPLFTWYSDSLPVVIKVINKNSQNLFAEMTLKTLGALFRHDGSFKGGCAVADSFFRTIGITAKDLAMYDGSGLSYTNQVKPDAIVKLLRYMYHSKNYELYYNSLGNPAEDRSMRNRLKDIPGRENVRAKGGYIMNVSTFSGYLTGPQNGHLYAFSIMVNNYTCTEDDVVSWQDRLLTILLKEF